MSKAKPDPRVRPPEELLPLKPAVFRIVLLLLEEERHGYGIVKELTRLKPPGLSLFPASLYRTLRRMQAEGVIESEKRTPTGADKPRMYYRVTSWGRLVAKAEARRLDDLVGTARSVRLLIDPDPRTRGAAPT